MGVGLKKFGMIGIWMISVFRKSAEKTHSFLTYGDLEGDLKSFVIYKSREIAM